MRAGVLAIGGMNMTEIFISYAREDRHLAEALANELEARGTSVWWDAELVGSDDYQEVILTALSKAKAAIVIWTTASVKSLFVRDEARYALHYKKLVAVKQPHLEVLQIPFGFQSQHTDDISDREQIFRAIEKLGVRASAAPVTLHGATDTGWDRVSKSSNVDDVLAWLEKNPSDPNRQTAIQRVREMVSHRAPGAEGQTSPAGLVRTSNWSAFLSGLTFRIPSFQLSTQGTWSSIGFAVGFLFLLAIGIFLWLLAIGAMLENELPDAKILPIAITLLAFLAYLTWLRFSSWATQRAFLASYIVIPFFLLLTLLLGLLLVNPEGPLVSIGLPLVPTFFATQVLAIGAVVWKIRSVR